jgi:predicted DNA-binding protein (UPF0251 family)
MRARRRTVTIGGVPRELPAACAARFEVVRGVLTGSLTLAQGARRLRTSRDELARLVEGARQAVIQQLGEHALEAARHAAHAC